MGRRVPRGVPRPGSVIPPALNMPGKPLMGNFSILIISILVRCANHLIWLLSTARGSSYTLIPLDVWAPHPVPKAKPSHPPEEPHLGHLYPRPCPSGHYSELITIGEGQNVDRWGDRSFALHGSAHSSRQCYRRHHNPHVHILLRDLSTEIPQRCHKLCKQEGH